jgi:acyl carrier protein
MHSKFVSDTEPQQQVEQQQVEQSIAQQHEILIRWAEIAVSDRQALLRAYIQAQIATSIGIDTSQLDAQQPLNYLGIDSLIAVKLRNQLRTDLEVDVPAVKFMEDSSVASIATLIGEQIENAYNSPPTSLGPHIPSLEKGREDLSRREINDDWLEGEI